MELGPWSLLFITRQPRLTFQIGAKGIIAAQAELLLLVLLPTSSIVPFHLFPLSITLSRPRPPTELPASHHHSGTAAMAATSTATPAPTTALSSQEIIDNFWKSSLGPEGTITKRKLPFPTTEIYVANSG
jgi:hypothetical protein